MRFYQLRLKKGQSLADTGAGLSKALSEALVECSAFGTLSAEELRGLDRELRAVFTAYVKAYDLCGAQALCEENLNPAAWNKAPDPELCRRLPWETEEVLRFRVEVKEELDEFLGALEAAVLRCVVSTPERAARAKQARRALETALVAFLGPHLYENPACGQCELCREAKPLDAWSR